MDFQKLLRQSLTLEGDLAEFGVYKGNSACIIADEIKTTTRTLWLFDSFEGLPALTNLDNLAAHFKGEFGDTSVELINKRINPIKGLANIRIIQGFFENTICEIENRKFCFVHLDCDLYESYKFVLEYIKPRMSKGGIIVLDDYRDEHNCPGAKKAVDEFLVNCEIKLTNTETISWLEC